MNRDPRNEIARLKAELCEGEEGPLSLGASLVQRHPFAVATGLIAAGLILKRYPALARGAIACAGWVVRRAML